MFSGHPSPVDALPKVIGNTIYEVEQHTQAPRDSIAVSALGIISLTCQNRTSVYRLNSLHGPVSSFLMTLAESDERKSTVGRLLMKLLYQLREDLFEKYTHDPTAWRNDEAISNVEGEALMLKLKLDIRRNKNHLATNERLKELLTTDPKAPVRLKPLFSDATPAAIKAHLYGHWRSVGITSDETRIISNGHTLNELLFINKMQDGSVFTMERKNEPGKLIRDARITLSLMIQPNAFKGYIGGKGGTAKGIGFSARCLMCQPASIQGNRRIPNPIFSNERLPVFHQRLIEIVNKSIVKISENSRVCLRSSTEVERHWIEFHNQVESEMRMIGLLYDFKNYTSKMAGNMVRLATLPHYFSGGGGGIPVTAVRAAVGIVAWHTEEYIRLLSKKEELSLDASGTNELYCQVKDYCT